MNILKDLKKVDEAFDDSLISLLSLVTNLVHYRNWFVSARFSSQNVAFTWRSSSCSATPSGSSPQCGRYLTRCWTPHTRSYCEGKVLTRFNLRVHLFMYNNNWNVDVTMRCCRVPPPPCGRPGWTPWPDCPTWPWRCPAPPPSTSTLPCMAHVTR